MAGLRAHDDPPPGTKHRWTERVLVETNLGNIYAISYMHGDDGGAWQRPGFFSKAEVVRFWMPLPEELR